MNIEQYLGLKNGYVFNELLDACFPTSQYSPDTIHWDVWGAQYSIRSPWLPSSNNIGLIIFWNAWILNNIWVWKMDMFSTNCWMLVFPPPSTLQTLYIEMYEVLNTTFEVHDCPSSNNIELMIFWNAWILNNIRVWKINIFLTNCLRLVFPPPSTLQTLYIEMYEVLNTIFEVHDCHLQIILG